MSVEGIGLGLYEQVVSLMFNISLLYEDNYDADILEISDLLEKLAPEQDKEQGNDIADYPIKQDWRLFKNQNIKETLQPEPQPKGNIIREKSEKCEGLKNTYFSTA